MRWMIICCKAKFLWKDVCWITINAFHHNLRRRIVFMKECNWNCVFTQMHLMILFHLFHIIPYFKMTNARMYFDSFTWIFKLLKNTLSYNGNKHQRTIFNKYDFNFPSDNTMSQRLPCQVDSKAFVHLFKIISINI